MIRNHCDSEFSLNVEEGDSIEIVEDHFETIDLEDILVDSEEEEEEEISDEGDWDSFIELYGDGAQQLHPSDSGFTEDATLSMISDENVSFVEIATKRRTKFSSEVRKEKNENASSPSPRISSPANNEHHSKTTPLQIIDSAIPYITKVSKNNDRAINGLLKATQQLIKNNIKVLKEIHAEKNIVQSRLDTSRIDCIRLHRQANEEREKFKSELRKNSREDKEQKARSEKLTDVIEELKETVFDQSRQLEEQKQAFKHLSDNVLEIMDEFGKSADTANQSLISNESRLQELFGKCETLVKNANTKKSTFGKKFSLNIFRTKKGEESSSLVDSSE